MTKTTSAAPKGSDETHAGPLDPQDGPTSISIVEALSDPRLFAPFLRDGHEHAPHRRGQGARTAKQFSSLRDSPIRQTSWGPWRCVLKALFGLDMTADERKLFRKIAGRTPPRKEVDEAY